MWICLLNQLWVEYMYLYNIFHIYGVTFIYTLFLRVLLSYFLFLRRAPVSISCKPILSETNWLSLYLGISFILVGWQWFSIILNMVFHRLMSLCFSCWEVSCKCYWSSLVHDGSYFSRFIQNFTFVFSFR